MKAMCSLLLALYVVINGLQVPVQGGITAWFVPSATKVMRDARPNNPISRTWNLAAAGNEVEACQLILLADRDVTSVSISVSELRMSDGKALLRPELFKVEYVPKIVGDTPYPDPLPPLGPLHLRANQAQPVWISIKVPKQAKPGLYVAGVRITSQDGALELPLRLQVFGFTLPDTPSGVTAFGLTEAHIAHHHGVPENSAESRRLYALYYEMLLDHRISALQIPVDVTSEAAAKYFSDPRMTSYQIPYPSGDAQMKAIVDRLRKNGWYSKGYFYAIDEPVTKDAYDILAKINVRLHACAPEFRWVVPFNKYHPQWDNNLTAFDLMANRANIWCPNLGLFEGHSAMRSDLATRRRLGESTWWYVCCGPREPYNNFFLNMPAISHRVLFWQQKRESVTGLLYWGTNWWMGVTDPWADMATTKDIDINLRGDGSLFYPGKKVGVNGPVSSIRLEVIRDGLEDYDYLTLAEAWLGKEAASGYITRIAQSLVKWEHDPIVLEKVRCELGFALEKNNPLLKRTHVPLPLPVAKSAPAGRERNPL